MSDPSKRVKMRVNVAGYGGQAVSVFAGYDPDSDVLAIVREGPYEVTARDGWLRVTTQDRDPTHDAVFTDDQARDAIAAYFELEAMNLIQFSEGLARLDPKNKIERDGMDESGMKYRIHPEITNGQVAVMIAALSARRQRGAAAADQFMADLGQVLTI